ncbi:MAG TPA: universal stress protein [Candidatus Limnocylindria bacterium]|nr:universal stress protein [Candidatus Limnocylindria bacterium]
MNILLALDGSPSSLVARDLVAGLSWPEATTVDLLAAYQTPIDWSGGMAPADWMGEVDEATRGQLAEDLEAAAAPLLQHGLAVERHVVAGRPATEIVAAAHARDAALVVMGSRGRGPLRSMLLGSVAGEVTAHAACPVLVARHPTVTRLVVATDGSAGAELIPDRLAALGAFTGVPADVVAVSIPDTPTFELIVGLYTLGDERLSHRRQELRQRFAAAADRMVERLTAVGIPATGHVRAGDPAHEVLALAREREADLVVTGSRGLGALDRLLLGSVARNVLHHATASVLVVGHP